MSLKRGYVELSNYDSKWQEEYRKEEKILKNVLKDKIIEIHHIGSTSIPGVKAKPIIDILIVITNLNAINEIEELLKDYNYTNRGKQGVEDRIFFAKGNEDARSHYIHFTEPNSDTYYNQMYFKKYLIDNPEYIKKYNDLKEELANKFANDRPMYTKGKSEFIKNVIELARAKYSK